MTRLQKAWLLPVAAFCLCLGILPGRLQEHFLLPLSGVLLSLVACKLLKGRLRFGACLLLAFCLGCTSASFCWHPSLPPEDSYQVEGIITDEIRTGDLGQVKTELSIYRLNGQEVSLKAWWTFYADEVPQELLPGKQVTLTAEVYHPDGADTEYGYDYREDLLRRGITVGLYGNDELLIQDASFFHLGGFTASLRHQLTQALITGMGEESGGYAAAMLLGMKSAIDETDRAAFSKLGIAHVLSVSGFHVGVLVAGLALLFRLLHLGQKLRWVLYLLLLSFYSLLCGSASPVIRASILLLLANGGRILHRPRSSLHLLCAALMLILLFSPVQLTGLSFQLSFGAMFGLILVAPFLQSLFLGTVRRKHPVRRYLASGLSAGLGAQLGILLPELYTFQQLPLLGLVLNIPVSLAASVMISLYWLCLLSLPFPGLFSLLCSAAQGFTGFFLKIIRYLGTLSGITLWTHASTWATVLGVILLFVALCHLLNLSKRPRFVIGSLGLIITCLSLFPWPHTTTEYIQFSVGNADAALIWDQDTVVVIDTGTDDNVLSNFLHHNRLTPEAIILTHLHADHIGGLQGLLDADIPIKKLYLAPDAENAAVSEEALSMINTLRQQGSEIIDFSAGDIYPLPSGSIEVLWPEAGKVRKQQDANDSSMALSIKLQDVTLLQMGDLSGTYENYAVQSCHLLKIAHHGSTSSTSEAFLQLAAPQAILLSCDKEKRHEQVAERTGGIPLYSTALSGTLTVHFQSGHFTIESYK